MVDVLLVKVKETSNTNFSYLRKSFKNIFHQPLNSCLYCGGSGDLTFDLSGGNTFNWTKLVEEKKHKQY
jgi:hypothetical protein